jgi:hypothetical protein
VILFVFGLRKVLEQSAIAPTGSCLIATHVVGCHQQPRADGSVDQSNASPESPQFEKDDGSDVLGLVLRLHRAKRREEDAVPVPTEEDGERRAVTTASEPPQQDVVEVVDI